MNTRGKTKKTQVVRQYSRFISPGSVRVEATPAYDEVMASAYLTPAGDAVTLVLINPRGQEQPVTVALRGGPKVSQWQVIRTSSTEDCQLVVPVDVTEGKAAFTMPAQCIVTLTSAKWREPREK